MNWRQAFSIDKSNSFLSHLLLFLLSAIFIVFLFGKNIFAQFWLIDDHSIITFIGDGGKTIFNFFDMLSTTEVWQFGTSNRYRPGYYTWYILECLAWGFNPMAWYISRLLMASVFVYSFIYCLRSFIGVMGAVFFTFFMFTFGFWNDIWSRLGTGEVYAACGLGVFLIAFMNLYKNIQSGDKSWYHTNLALLSFGVFTAAGSKENFVLLALPLLYLFFISFRKDRKFNKLFSWVILANLVFILLIVIAIVFALAKSKVDFYVNPVTITSRSMLILKLFQIRFIQGTLILSLMSLLIGFHLGKKPKYSSSALVLKYLSFVYFSCFFLYLTQYVFYNGSWPTGMRYDFPGFLSAPLFYLATFVAIARVLVNQFNFLKNKTEYFNVLLSCILAVFILKVGFSEVRNGAEINLSRTTETYNHLKSVADLVQGTQKAIVLESHMPLNYESYFSIKAFMRYYFKLPNAIYLRIHGYSAETEKDPLMLNLTKVLEGIAAQDIKAIESLGDNCVSIYLSGDTKTNCQPTVRFW